MTLLPNIPSPIPVVILHSSCEEATSSPTSDRKQQLGENGDSADAGTALASFPVACDILIFPEIPSYANSGGHTKANDSAGPPFAQDFAELIQANLNPCGMANVFLLENLLVAPLSPGGFLLSLASCHLLHGASGTLFLPVEPIPSTFAFSFEASEDSIPQGLISDLVVGFDLSPARIRLLEYLEFSGNHSIYADTHTSKEADKQYESDGTMGVGQGSTICNPQSSSAPLPAGTPEVRPLDEIFDTDLDFHPHSQTDRRKPLTTGERDVLLRIQAIMKEEEESLGRILKGMASLGLCLFLLLLWTLWQLHQSEQESTARQKPTVTISRNASTTSRISDHTVQTSEFSPISVTPSNLVKKSLIDLETCRNVSVLPQVIPPGEPRPILSPSACMTPTRPIKSPTYARGTSPKWESHWAQRLLALQVTPPGSETFVNAIKAPSNASRTQGIPLRLGQAAGARKNEECPDSEISPCSKLAIAWSQRKRAPHKTRQIRKLNPALGGQSSVPHQDYYTAPPPRVDTTNHLNHNMLQPSLLQGNLSADDSDLREQPSRALGVSEVLGPLCPLSAPPLPELCSTPGSDEDSFIDDYW
jgi:hypothetical protein